MITLLMAIAVTQGVRELHLDAKIKWPNDVVINGKKICGILTEMYQSAAGSFFLVIGTGINVNQKEFPEEIADKATSLFIESGRHWKRDEEKHTEEKTAKCFRSMFAQDRTDILILLR